ncbi:MAG: bifunctional phosphopantothenoylcysteine decarboxylase/phosphopantothenate--cysteine ligase CoaBC [Candidatus Methanomethylophilaceae archaeon]|nr:bifunctional phosphopantothenoylcysteine decarboxylase/phosphopantothenate--cysteine ligase CoaBC [Candidatus Methanomethylophilaceae archaeon]
MHPSEEIYCEKSQRLRGKTIVIGMTGSIAVTECFSLIREMIRNGAKVIPVMTPSAAKLVAPDAIEYASGMKPIIELTGQCEHVKYLGGKMAADLFLVYPATANTISKIANGVDDTSVTSMATIALGSNIPVVVAPAMHESMYKNPAVIKNVETLESWGVHIIGPHCDGDKAKVASKEEIMAWSTRMLSRDDLNNRRILVIGGRSEEPLDSMRIITNRSTGLMSLTLALRAFERGAKVELWMGACNVNLPDHIPTKRFATVADLVAMVDTIDHDVVIVPAALADFAPADSKSGKIPSDQQYDMMLNPVPKVLPLIRKKCDNVIGFKAESGLDRKQLEEKARQRLKMYDLKAVVANDIDVVGKTSSYAILVTAESSKDISGTKVQVSDAILGLCVEKK